MPMFVPEGPNEVWSADFMTDALYHGTRFRTLNVLDDYNREALAIKGDTSLRAKRVIRVLDRLKGDRELPHMLRVDNGPEFLAQSLQEWGKANGVLTCFIQPGRPMQNAFIERFNRTYRKEVFNLYLFHSLEQGREITAGWMTIYRAPLKTTDNSVGLWHKSLSRRNTYVNAQSTWLLGSDSSL